MNRPNSRLKATPMPRRTTALPSTSARARSERAGQQRVYRETPQQDWCAACGHGGPLDHSHILTQGQHPKHRNNPLNWLMLCRGCHSTWEDNKARFRMLYPAAFAEKMRRMQLVDAQAYAVFRMKHSDLFK